SARPAHRHGCAAAKPRNPARRSARGTSRARGGRAAARRRRPLPSAADVGLARSANRCATLPATSSKTGEKMDPRTYGQHARSAALLMREALAEVAALDKAERHFSYRKAFRACGENDWETRAPDERRFSDSIVAD